MIRNKRKMKKMSNRILHIVCIALITFIMHTDIFGTVSVDSLLTTEIKAYGKNMTETIPNLSETIEELLTDIWYDSTEEAVARTLANEKEEEYGIANKSYADYDELVGRGSSIPSDVMSYLGKLKLDADIKRFYVEYENEIYNDAKNRFLYDMLLKLLEYDLEQFEKKYTEAALAEAESAKRCTEIKVDFGVASLDSLEEVKATVSEYEKQAEKVKKDIEAFKDSFSARYPNVDFPDEDIDNADCFTGKNTSDSFAFFARESMTEHFLRHDITYIQMEYVLETYKSHMDKYGKYMRQNRDYKREAEREQADILYMSYCLAARKEMIKTSLESLLAEYEALEKEIDLAAERLVLARKNMETEQRKYAIGFSTKLILLKKEAELRKTEYTLENLKTRKIKMEFMIENGILP